jgi:microcystin-dependent protein
MAADFSKPTVSSTKTGVLSEIRDMFAALATMAHTASSNKPTGTIQLNTTTGRFERWNGSAWESILIDNNPVSTMLAYGGASAPSGYLLCDGSPVSQTTYAALYAIVGHQYGTDPGGGNFLLPDMRDKVAGGAGTGYGVVGVSSGADTVSIAEANLPSHAHAAGSLAAASDGAHGHTTSGTADSAGAHTHDISGSEGYSVAGQVLAGATMVSAHTFATESGGAHTHTTSGTAASAGAHGHTVSGSTGSIGSGTALANRQATLAHNWIIRV